MKMFTKVLSTCVAAVFFASSVGATEITLNRFTMLAEGLGLSQEQKAKFQDEFTKNITTNAKEDFGKLIANMYAEAGKGIVAPENISKYYDAIVGLQKDAQNIIKGDDVSAAVSTVVAGFIKVQTGTDAGTNVGAALVSYLAKPVGLLFGDSEVGKNNYDYFAGKTKVADADISKVKDIFNAVTVSDAQKQFYNALTFSSVQENQVNGGVYVGNFLVPVVIVDLIVNKNSALIQKALAEYPAIGAIVTGTGKTVADLSKDADAFSKWLAGGLAAHEFVETNTPGIDHAQVVEKAESGDYAQYKGFFDFMQSLYDFEIGAVEQSTGLQMSKLQQAGAAEASVTDAMLQDAITNKTPIYVTKSAAEKMNGTFAYALLDEMKKKGFNVMLNETPAETLKGAVVFTADTDTTKYSSIVVKVDDLFKNDATVQYYFKSILMKLLAKAKDGAAFECKYDEFSKIFDVNNDGFKKALENLIAPAAAAMLKARTVQIAA